MDELPGGQLVSRALIIAEANSVIVLLFRTEKVGIKMTIFNNSRLVHYVDYFREKASFLLEIFTIKIFFGLTFCMVFSKTFISF